MYIRENSITSSCMIGMGDLCVYGRWSMGFDTVERVENKVYRNSITWQNTSRYITHTATNKRLEFGINDAKNFLISVRKRCNFPRRVYPNDILYRFCHHRVYEKFHASWTPRFKKKDRCWKNQSNLKKKLNISSMYYSYLSNHTLSPKLEENFGIVSNQLFVWNVKNEVSISKMIEGMRLEEDTLQKNEIKRTFRLKNWELNFISEKNQQVQRRFQ